MKLGTTPFAAALAILAAACARSAPAPATEVRPIDGAGFRELLRASEGRPLVVNFWATWCEPCRDELPALEAIARELGDGVRVVGVSVDDPRRLDGVKSYLAGRGISFPQYIRAEQDDEAFINAVDPTWSGAVPTTFLFDGRGARAGRLVGQQSRESLEQALAPLLADASRLRPEPAARSAR